MPIIIDTGATSVTVGPASAGPQATPPGYTPHLQFPFQWLKNPDGSVDCATVEQDTLEEIVGCVRAILVCPSGYRDELPEFGVRSLEFVQAPVNTADLGPQVGRWEPRANLEMLEFADPASVAWRHVQIGVSADGSGVQPSPGAAGSVDASPPAPGGGSSGGGSGGGSPASLFPGSGVYPGSSVYP